MIAWNCTLDVLKKQMSLLRWNNLISLQTRIFIATRYLIEEASYLMLSLVLPCFYYSLHNKNCVS